MILPRISAVAVLAFLPVQAAVPAFTDAQSSFRGPISVSVEQSPKGWRLMRSGLPYFVKGACVWGENVRLDELRAAGANSVRTYHSKHARWTLEAAHRRGMTVMLGFEINNENHGFSYLNKEHVQEQRNRLKAFVQQHKDHPAVLAWGIGNEVEQGVENPVHLEAMWKELNALARMVKEIDPWHPTAIILAGAKDDKLEAVQKWCPDVDIVCFNTYGGLRNLPAYLDKQGWKKPYLITEFGAIGWWEAPLTKWGAPIEQTSTEKAREYLVSYQRGVLGDKRRCLGSYVFFWEPKQEATATWFGMFLPGGERLEMIDAMTQAWSRKRPPNRSPQIRELEFVTKDEKYQPGQEVRVKLAVSDPEKQPLGLSWRIVEEAPAFTPGNAYEIVPRALREQIVTSLPDGAQFPAPQLPGAYRIFVYVYDGQGNAATGNLCFQVVEPPPAELAPPVVPPIVEPASETTPLP